MSHSGAQPGIGSILRRLAPMIYGPTVLFSLGEGALIPLLPVLTTRLGGDLTVAALIASALVVGQLVGNLPAGWAVARFGERVTMVAAGIVCLVAVIAGALATSIGMLGVAVFAVGFCAAAFGLARHSFMTTRVPIGFRARALSLLGGSFRLGVFVGPFVSAALLGVFSTVAASAWFFALCLVAMIALVLLGPDPERIAAPAGVPSQPSETTLREAQGPDGRADAEDSGEPVTGTVPTLGRVGVFRTMWRHRGVLLRLGAAAASLSAVRSARQAVLPLWGVSIGLDAQTIALVVGVSGAIDFALFYASGQVMDRFGRLWAALPAMLLMGAGFLALSFTHDLPANAMWFALFAAVLGVGNGLSSGILLTLGADVAPREDPAPFLGSWRTLTDAGGAAAPLLVTLLTAVASLALATGAIGAIGLLGALGFLRWVPRFVPSTSPDPGREETSGARRRAGPRS